MTKILSAIDRESRLILIGAGTLLAIGMGIRQSFGPFLTTGTKFPTDPCITLAQGANTADRDAVIDARQGNTAGHVLVSG